MRLALLVLLAPAVAAADPTPSFEVLDRGNAVEVVAHGFTAAKTAITPIRSRLEVPLVGRPRADKLLPTDATVKVVELDGTEQRVLSVKLGFERPEVKALAKYAQAIQVGDDVHIIVPRTVPAPGTAFVLPEPTLPPAIAAKLAAPKEAEPVAPAEATAAAPKEAEPVAPIEPTTAAPPAAATTTATTTAAPTPTPPATEQAPATKPTAPAAPAPATKQVPGAATTSSSPLQNLSLYAALGLVAIGCVAWLVKRKKRAQGPISSIDVIAQRGLGGKAKVVWFTAGGREMVVAVTPQQVRMLGQWKRGEAAAPSASLPHAQAMPEPKPSSAAVSGILKLRERAGTMPVADPGDSEDVDAAWAREILAATGARR